MISSQGSVFGVLQLKGKRTRAGSNQGLAKKARGREKKQPMKLNAVLSQRKGGRAWQKPKTPL